MVFAYTVVINTLLGTMSFYANRIPFGGLGGWLDDPGRPSGPVLALHPQRGPALLPMADGVAFGFVFVVAPEMAAIGLLTRGGKRAQHLPLHAPDPLPLLAAAGPGAGAGDRVRGRRPCRPGFAATWRPGGGRRRLRVVPVLGAGPVLPADVPAHEPEQPPDARHQRRARAVPPNAVVSAYYPYVAHLDHRTRIYQWPTPFSAQYWGLYTQEGQRLPFADQVQYVVLPSDLSTISPSDEAVWTTISRQFETVGQGGGVVVYRRVAAG